MNSLVLGSAGFIGVNLAELLVKTDRPFRAGRRRRTNVLPLRSLKSPLVYADLDDPESLIAAMSGVRTVFHLAGYYPKLSIDPELSIKTGCRQLKNALDAAARTRVERFVYVSSTATVAQGSRGSSNEDDVFHERPNLGAYIDLKWEMEQIANREDRFEVITACPSACIGPWDLRIGTSALLVALARGTLRHYPDGWINLVDVRDVASALVKLAELESPPKRILLSAHGFELVSLLEKLANRYGVERPPRPLGLEEAQKLADAEERHAALTPGYRPALSREIVDLIAGGRKLDTSRADSLLQIEWCTLDETLDAFDGWARRLKIIPEINAHRTGKVLA